MKCRIAIIADVWMILKRTISSSVTHGFTQGRHYRMFASSRYLNFHGGIPRHLFQIQWFATRTKWGFTVQGRLNSHGSRYINLARFPPFNMCWSSTLHDPSWLLSHWRSYGQWSGNVHFSRSTITSCSGLSGWIECLWWQSMFVFSWHANAVSPPTDDATVSWSSTMTWSGGTTLGNLECRFFFLCFFFRFNDLGGLMVGSVEKVVGSVPAESLTNAWVRGLVFSSCCCVGGPRLMRSSCISFSRPCDSSNEWNGSSISSECHCCASRNTLVEWRKSLPSMKSLPVNLFGGIVEFW